MYRMYLDGVQVPVMPAKIQMKIKGCNNTMTLISGEEVNLLKAAGLTEVSFELLLPQSNYPFAVGQGAAQYLSLLERLKVQKKPFQWILTRERPDGSGLFHSNLTVSLEDYQITEDAGEGFDLKVKVNLKQYRSFGTKTAALLAAEPSEPAQAAASPSPRPAGDAPKAKTYTVVKGDCLWNIAKKFLGDGSRYTEIYRLNKDKVKNPNLIYPGQVLTLPD